MKKPIKSTDPIKAKVAKTFKDKFSATKITTVVFDDKAKILAWITYDNVWSMKTSVYDSFHDKNDQELRIRPNCSRLWSKFSRMIISIHQT